MTVAVVIAVCASVPAVFLTVFADGDLALAGKVIGWVSGGILWGESLVMLAAAENKTAWLLRHKWLLFVSGLTLLSLVIAAGGVQFLRFISAIGSIRILRAKRIISAAQVLSRRLTLGIGLRSAMFTAAGLLPAAFVAVVIAHPTSDYASLLTWIDHNLRLLPILLAGAVLAAATWLLVRFRAEEKEDERE